MKAFFLLSLAPALCFAGPSLELIAIPLNGTGTNSFNLNEVSSYYSVVKQDVKVRGLNVRFTASVPVSDWLTLIVGVDSKRISTKYLGTVDHINQVQVIGSEEIVSGVNIFGGLRIQL